MIDDRTMKQQWLVTFFQRNLDEQRAEALVGIARNIERLSKTGWDLLRNMPLTWENTESSTTPGFSRMVRIAEQLLGRQGTIVSISLRPTDEQEDCFFLYVDYGSGAGGRERRVHPRDLIAVAEAVG